MRKNRKAAMGGQEVTTADLLAAQERHYLVEAALGHCRDNLRPAPVKRENTTPLPVNHPLRHLKHLSLGGGRR